MGKVKRLKLWWQLYRTLLPVRDLENFWSMDFCWTECTFRQLVTLEASGKEAYILYNTCWICCLQSFWFNFPFSKLNARIFIWKTQTLKAILFLLTFYTGQKSVCYIFKELFWRRGTSCNINIHLSLNRNCFRLCTKSIRDRWQVLKYVDSIHVHEVKPMDWDNTFPESYIQVTVGVQILPIYVRTYVKEKYIEYKETSFEDRRDLIETYQTLWAKPVSSSWNLCRYPTLFLANAKFRTAKGSGVKTLKFAVSQATSNYNKEKLINNYNN